MCGVCIRVCLLRAPAAASILLDMKNKIIFGKYARDTGDSRQDSVGQIVLLASKNR